MWPTDAESLAAAQRQLADASPELWSPQGGSPLVGACWVCFPRGLSGRGSAEDPAWAAAVVMSGGHVVSHRVVTGVAGAPYVPGLLALRIGPLMERAVHGLATRPDVVLLDATGRDHPAWRRVGAAAGRGARPADGGHHAPAAAGPGRVARRPPRGDESAAARRQGGRVLDAHAARGPSAGRAPRLAGRPGHGGRAGGEHLGAMAHTRAAAPCAPRCPAGAPHRRRGSRCLRSLTRADRPGRSRRRVPLPGPLRRRGVPVRLPRVTHQAGRHDKGTRQHQPTDEQAPSVHGPPAGGPGGHPRRDVRPPRRLGRRPARAGRDVPRSPESESAHHRKVAAGTGSWACFARFWAAGTICPVTRGHRALTTTVAMALR